MVSVHRDGGEPASTPSRVSHAQRQRALRNAEIRTLLKLGRMTNQQIANRTDVSVRTVVRIKRDARLTGKGRHQSLTTEQRTRAECLLADGCSLRETARSIGCSDDQLRTAFPGRAWTIDQKVESEQITGLRQRTAPHIPAVARRRSKGSRHA